MHELGNDFVVDFVAVFYSIDSNEFVAGVIDAGRDSLRPQPIRGSVEPHSYKRVCALVIGHLDRLQINPFSPKLF